MQSIVRLFDRLRQVNFERLFVVSVVVATLLGSLYVYVVDFYLAGFPDEAAEAPDVAVRLAPIGRVVLAEAAAVAPSGAESIQVDPGTSTDSGMGAEAETPAVESVRVDPGSGNGSGVGAEVGAPLGEPALVQPDEPSIEGTTSEPSSGGAVSEVPASDREPREDVSVEDRPVESPPVESAAGDDASSQPIEPGPAPAEVEDSAAAESPAPSQGVPVQGYPPPRPGFMPMPMPGQAYAPAYPRYQPPPGDARPQAPGAPPWYGPYRQYQPHTAPQYERPSGSAPGYPAPPGWTR
jgi:hypothetical protein